MRLCVALLLAGLLAGAHAGSGKDAWGIDTLVNYPAGQGRKEVPVQANDVGEPTPVDLKCQCSDADPRDDKTQLVTYDCFYQRLFGNCNDTTFMFDANAELSPEGFCQISCSRCNCCTPPYDVLQSLGATRFLQALDAAEPSMKQLFQHPGYMNTILVPNNAAWDAALEKYGSALTQPAVLQQVLKFHILPPEPTRRGLWTSPFLSLGPKLYTAYDGPNTLSTQRFQLPADVTWEGGLTGFTIDGPLNSATVLRSDVQSCKSYITVIDSVLLPFNPTTLPPEDWLKPSAAVGVKGCFVQANGMVTGTTLKAGDANSQADAGACCDSCKSTAGCNAWVFCSQKGGCRAADGSVTKFGFCELKTSPEVATGQPANYSDFSVFTVPFISGYVEAPGAVNGAAASSPAAAIPPAGELQVAAAGERQNGGL